MYSHTHTHKLGEKTLQRGRKQSKGRMLHDQVYSKSIENVTKGRSVHVCRRAQVDWNKQTR